LLVDEDDGEGSSDDCIWKAFCIWMTGMIVARSFGFAFRLRMYILGLYNVILVQYRVWDAKLFTRRWLFVNYFVWMRGKTKTCRLGPRLVSNTDEESSPKPSSYAGLDAWIALLARGARGEFEIITIRRPCSTRGRAINCKL
jgi:hypothetical protein